MFPSWGAQTEEQQTLTIEEQKSNKDWVVIGQSFTESFVDAVFQHLDYY